MAYDAASEWKKLYLAQKELVEILKKENGELKAKLAEKEGRHEGN